MDGLSCFIRGYNLGCYNLGIIIIANQARLNSCTFVQHLSARTWHDQQKSWCQKQTVVFQLIILHIAPSILWVAYASIDSTT